jgi:hypothetical protein
MVHLQLQGESTERYRGRQQLIVSNRLYYQEANARSLRLAGPAIALIQPPTDFCISRSRLGLPKQVQVLRFSANTEQQGAGPPCSASEQAQAYLQACSPFTLPSLPPPCLRWTRAC